MVRAASPIAEKTGANVSFSHFHALWNASMSWPQTFRPVSVDVKNHVSAPTTAAMAATMGCRSSMSRAPLKSFVARAATFVAPAYASWPSFIIARAPVAAPIAAANGLKIGASAPRALRTPSSAPPPLIRASTQPLITYTPSVMTFATFPIAGAIDPMMLPARLLNADFMFFRRPDVVSDMASIVPVRAVVAPAAPSEPSMMPLVRTSMDSAAGTVPEEIIFSISAVVTPALLARIARPLTPPSARELMVSMLILPVAAAVPKARPIEFRASSPLPEADAASPRAVTMPAVLSASMPNATRFFPASDQASKV